MAGLSLVLAAGAEATQEPWVTPEQLDGCNTTAVQVDLESVCAVATEMLFKMSGRRYGVRTETIRPTQNDYWCHRWPQALNLKSPVRSIDQVKVDGEILPQGSYRLFDNRHLVRSDGTRTSFLNWPMSQRLELDDDQEGTFSVTYKWGQSVPPGGLMAAQAFACELAKYLAGDKRCLLTNRLSAITRQGVSQEFVINDEEISSRFKTGIFLVDSWIQVVNPNNLPRGPRILGPDSVRKARPT